MVPLRGDAQGHLRPSRAAGLKPLSLMAFVTTDIEDSDMAAADIIGI